MVEQFGAPADYVQAFGTDGQLFYPEPRTYIEWQSWLTPVGMVPGHHSEHMHLGACVPQGETWLSPNDDRHLDVKAIFHNLAGYEVTGIGGMFHFCLPGKPCDGNHHDSTPVVEAAETAAVLPTLNDAAQASAGGNTVARFMRFKVRPTDWNGFKEIRMTLSTERSGPAALVERWSLDARWYASDFYEGLPDGLMWTGEQYLRCRTIAGFFNQDGVFKTDYHHAGFNLIGDYELFRNAQPAAWDVPLQVTDGGGTATLEIDPNHHVHPDSRGIWHSDFTMFSGPGQPALRTEPVPLGTLGLAPGSEHKLFFGSDDEPGAGERPPWRNVTVIPFTAPGPTCEEQVAALEAEVARLNDIADRAALVLAER